MRLLLIRHGETEHNVAGLLAGVTDSRLTNHGVLQAQRLGSALIETRQLQFSHIFASDLQRAWMTADQIHLAQTKATSSSPSVNVVQLSLLREQDFGSFELFPWASKRADDAMTTHVPSATDPNFKPKETAEQMKARADLFLDDFLTPILTLNANDQVAVVSHGLFLSALWRALLGRFRLEHVSVSPDLGARSPSWNPEYIGSWSNTAYLELLISTGSTPDTDSVPVAVADQGQVSAAFTHLHLQVMAINRRDHLDNLKRTRGVGSATHDARQQQISSFFRPPG